MLAQGQTQNFKAMNKFNKKIAYILAFVILFSGFSTMANGLAADSSEISIQSSEIFVEETMTDIEMDEIMLSLESDHSNWLEDAVTYYVYDTNDNLVLSVTTSRLAPLDDVLLVETLAKSDLLMTYNNELYYRLNPPRNGIK